MADRTSAELFGRMFEYLANQRATKERDKFVDWLWNQTADYDFDPYQMGEDDALMKLGLAKEVPNREYPDEGPVIVYKGDDGFEED